MMRGATSVLRRLAVLLALGLVVAVPAVRADDQTDPARLAGTATSDHCAKGLPVVDYTLANLWPSKVAVEVWWEADESVSGIVGTVKLEPSPDSSTGSFSLPYDFYTTVYATATWPDGTTTTNASWTIPVADCTGATTTTTTTTIVESTTTTTVDDGKVKDDKDKDDKDVTTTTVGVG